MPTADETTTVRKATRQKEGRAVVRTVDTETTQRRRGTVVKKVDSVLKTRSETPETEKGKLAKVTAKRAKPPEPRPLSNEFFRTLLGTLETERRALPTDAAEFNAKAAKLYEELRHGINKAARVVEDPEWKRALHELVDDSKRSRAALAAMQLHGEARQVRQREYWQTVLDRAFALLRRAAGDRNNS